MEEGKRQNKFKGEKDVEMQKQKQNYSQHVSRLIFL